jgi:hypothetical protein
MLQQIRDDETKYHQLELEMNRMKVGSQDERLLNEYNGNFRRRSKPVMLLGSCDGKSAPPAVRKRDRV